MTEQVPVEPVEPARPAAPAAAWAGVVQRLLGARSAAFATGRPELLLAADAAGSDVLAADRALLAGVVGPSGTGRVLGLTFDLSNVRTVDGTPRLVRVTVTGRQARSVAVLAGTWIPLPAGPVRTVDFELTRAVPATPAGSWGPWRLSRGWISHA